jgi:hypothetical protein
MIQIIDNATFRAWVINYAKEQKKTRYEICAKVAKTIKKKKLANIFFIMFFSLKIKLAVSHHNKLLTANNQIRN